MEYTLENEYLKLTVASLGAEVVSLVRKSDGVEHIWQADPAVWRCHAPVLFPHCGKVVEKAYQPGTTCPNCGETIE